MSASQGAENVRIPRTVCSAPLLSVRDLRVAYRHGGEELLALRGVDLELAKGRVLGLAGESGSGKTTLALAIGQLLDASAARYVSGSIRFQGRELLGASPAELRAVRGRRIAYVFQEPTSAFNPVMRVGEQVAEVLVAHRGCSRTEAQGRVHELLRRVGIADPDERAAQYPHQLSGGLLQRAMIAMALAGEPELIIADEPTSALDVTIQAQIIGLLKTLRREFGVSMIFVSHDLELLFDLCDEVVVMYAGQVVERAAAADMQRAPRHPYTEGLVACLPGLHPDRETLPAIPGDPPTLRSIPQGCAFHPRCGLREERCVRQEQALVVAGVDHEARCWKRVGGT